MPAGVFEGIVSRYSPDAKDSGGSSSQEDEETVVSDLQHALSGIVPEPELDTYLGYLLADEIPV